MAAMAPDRKPPAAQQTGRAMAPLRLRLLLLLLGPGSMPLTSSQLPRTPPNWALNRSTIIMPCNSTGLLDPATTEGWAVVDFDVRLAFF